MVEFGQEFDKPSKSNPIDRNPKSPGELLDAFHVFTDVPLNLRLVYLSFLQGLDSVVIANALDLRYSEVENRISEAKNILLHYASSLVDAEIEGSEVPENETSHREKTNFVRRLIEAVPKDYFEVYRRSRKKETAGQIARSLGLAEEDVVHLNRITRQIFLVWTNVAIRHLAEIDSESPSPLDQMLGLADRVREIKRTASIAIETLNRSRNEAKPKPSRDEIQVTEKLCYDMDAACREVFELDAVETGRSEIADILDIAPETVRIRLKKARRILVGQMERLIVSMLLNRKKKPNAPRMKRNTLAAARTLYGEIPEPARKIYSLFMATGRSEEEIASRLLVREEEVGERIKEAKIFVRKRVLFAAILAVRKGENVPAARKRVLARLRYIMALRRGEQPKCEFETAHTLDPLDGFRTIRNRPVFREPDRKTATYLYAVQGAGGGRE